MVLNTLNGLALINQVFLFQSDKEELKPFCVPAGTLYFNVIVFCVCAFFALVILTVRRYSEACGKAELGGPTKSRWISAVLMIVLWMVYIGLSSWNATVEKNKNKDLTYGSLVNSTKVTKVTDCVKYVRKRYEERMSNKK